MDNMTTILSRGGIDLVGEVELCLLWIMASFGGETLVIWQGRDDLHYA